MARVFDPRQNTGTTQAPTLNTGGPAATTSAPSQNKPVASGRFTNVQKYMNANRPDQFAQQVAGKVGQQAQGVKQNVGQAQQGFEQAAQAGRVDTAQNIQSVQNIYNPESAGQFANVLKSTGYTGPKELENKQALAAQAKRVQQTGQNLATAPGRQQVVGQMFGRPTYSTGQKRFDTLLLGQDKSKALQQARAGTMGLEDVAQQADVAAQQRAQELAKTSQALIGQAKDVYGREVGTSAESVLNKAKDVSAQRAKAFSDAVGRAQAGHLTPEDMAALGLSEGDTLYTGLSNYFQPGQINVNATQVATPEQQAKMKLLAQIANQSGQSTQGLDTVQQIANAQEIGKLEPLYGFNKSGFTQANEAARAQYLRDTAEEQDRKNAVNTAYNSAATQKANLKSMLPGDLGEGTDAEFENNLNNILKNPASLGKNQRLIPIIQAYKQSQDSYNKALAAQAYTHKNYDQNWGNLKKVIRG